MDSGGEEEELEEIRKDKLRKLLERQHSMMGQRNIPEWPKKPIKITDSSISKVIKEYPLVIIDCWAQWCGPCHAISPVIDDLALNYSGKILFGKLNVDENRITSTNYNIMTIPMLLIFKKGKLIGRVVGAMPRQELEPIIAQHLWESKEEKPTEKE